MITDETAPQRVLQESGPSQNKASDVVTKKKEELHTYGIRFDDDYDYLQHLRQPGTDVVEWEYVEPTTRNKNREKPQLQLPSSVFASEFEEDEGLLLKAAPRFGPRPDWDPDVVAALEEDFDYENPENALEDNFMELAMDPDGEGSEDYDSDDDSEEYSDVDSDEARLSDDEIGDNLGPMRERRMMDEEIGSRFTDYSMSSSVIRRNDQLQLLDDRFEKFFENYDETEIGPLDCEEIEGHLGLQDEMLRRYADQYKKEQEIESYNKKWDVERIKRISNLNDEEEMVELEVDVDRKKRWDCESILSTNSNIYNHPKLIQEPRKIKINPKTGLPLDVFRGEGGGKLTAKTLAKLNDGAAIESTGPKSLCHESVLSTLSILSIRPKDETSDEKKERKKLLREYRGERRAERKANVEAFKDEKKRQVKIQLNNRNNIQGKKIV